MMPIYYDFINNASNCLLRAYFEKIGVILKNQYWEKENKKNIIQEINCLPSIVVSRINADVKQITSISDKNSHGVFLRILGRNKKNPYFDSPIDLSFWCYLYDKKTFQNVKDVIYTNRYCNSVYCGKYLIDGKLNKTIYQATINKFKIEISSIIDNCYDVSINYFFYFKHESNNNPAMFQLMINFEEPNDESCQDNYLLKWSVIFDVELKTIEVVACKKEYRVFIAKQFIKHLIKDNNNYCLWNYNLMSLLEEKDFGLFDREKNNGIKSIYLASIKFRNVSDNNVILLKCPDSKIADINKYIVEKFNNDNPLINGVFFPVYACFKISFALPDHDLSDVLLVKIASPNKDNLHAFSFDQKKSIRKYFNRINLLEDVSMAWGGCFDLTVKEFKLLLMIIENQNWAISSDVLFSTFHAESENLINKKFLRLEHFDNGLSNYILDDDVFLNFIHEKLMIPERQKHYFILDKILCHIGSTCIKDCRVSFYFSYHVSGMINNHAFINTIKNRIDLFPAVILHSGKCDVKSSVFPDGVLFVSLYKIISYCSKGIKFNTNMLYSLVIGNFNNNTVDNSISFSSDYRSINWKGKFYTMTKRQAMVIECLYNEAGKVHHDFIKNQIGVNENISKIMRNRKNGKWVFHPLWKTLIKNYPNGYYYLDI